MRKQYFMLFFSLFTTSLIAGSATVPVKTIFNHITPCIDYVDDWEALGNCCLKQEGLCLDACGSDKDCRRGCAGATNWCRGELNEEKGKFCMPPNRLVCHQDTTDGPRTCVCVAPQPSRQGF